MNTQHQQLYNFAKLSKENTQLHFGENSLQKYNEFANTGGKFILLTLVLTLTYQCF